MLDEIEEFITGVRGGFDAERVLVTLVFTDIVGSTSRAAHSATIAGATCSTTTTPSCATSCSASVVVK